MKPRDYQETCINNVLNDNGNSLVVIATGGGKSFIFSLLVKKYLEQNKKILLIVNKELLLEQGHSNILRHADFECGYYYGKKKLLKDVTVATIQTVHKVEVQFDIIIFDEAHRFEFENKYSNVSKFLAKIKYEKIIGFTATPFREKYLIYGKDKIFKKITFEKRLKEMIDENYLVPVRYVGTKHNIDLSNVKKQGVDFSTSDLCKTIENNFDKVKLQVTEALERSVGYKKIIVLTTSIEHAEFVLTLLEDATIIHSKLSNEEQKNNYNNFANGNTKILVSVLIASEGLDIPEADCLWFMRPTRSPVLYIQAVGRVLRKFENKDHALVLDFGEIVKNLGDVTDIVDDHFNKDKKFKANECVKCNEIFSINANKCPICQTPIIVECKKCGKPFSKGEQCECQLLREKAASDSIAKLSNTPFDGDRIIDFDIERIQVLHHVGPSGNPCIRIIFSKGWVNNICSHFIFHWNYKQLCNSFGIEDKGFDIFYLIPQLQKAFEKVNKIGVVKDGNYHKLEIIY